MKDTNELKTQTIVYIDQRHGDSYHVQIVSGGKCLADLWADEFRIDTLPEHFRVMKGLAERPLCWKICLYRDPDHIAATAVIYADGILWQE